MGFHEALKSHIKPLKKRSLHYKIPHLKSENFWVIFAWFKGRRLQISTELFLADVAVVGSNFSLYKVELDQSVLLDFGRAPVFFRLENLTSKRMPLGLFTWPKAHNALDAPVIKVSGRALTAAR